MNKRFIADVYEQPQLSIFKFSVEAGFTLSEDRLGLPGENPDVNDFGDF